jgi:dsDNA-specific endonuclease/ATPase MutS2
MVDIKSLWIGDKLRVIENGQIGSFEGSTTVGTARVKIGSVMHFISPDALELIQDDPFEHLTPNVGIEYSSDVTISSAFNNEIDLHIEVLNPKFIDSSPSEILTHQKQRFQDFIKHAYKSGVSPVVVIHGKGAGVLLHEVNEVLRKFDFVLTAELVNNGGATRIYLKFN